MHDSMKNTCQCFVNMVSMFYYPNGYVLLKIKKKDRTQKYLPMSKMVLSKTGVIKVEESRMFSFEMKF